MSPDNAPVRNKYSGYLKLSCISMSVSFIFNILPVIISSLLACYNLNTINKIIIATPLLAVIPRVTMWHVVLFEDALLIKYYYYINVVCIQIILHWGTNQGCNTNQGNKVSLTHYQLQYILLQKGPSQFNRLLNIVINYRSLFLGKAVVIRSQ